MKVYVLMFGFDYEGYDVNVRVFTSKRAAEVEGEKGIGTSDDVTYDFYTIKAVEVE